MSPNGHKETFLNAKPRPISSIKAALATLTKEHPTLS